MDLIDLEGFDWGLATDETSLNIQSYDLNTAPQEITYIQNRVNDNRGKVNNNTRQTLVLSGHTTADTGGVMGFGFAAACVFASAAEFDVFGMEDGDWLMDAANLSRSFNGMKTFTGNFSRDALITVAA